MSFQQLIATFNDHSILYKKYTYTSQTYWHVNTCTHCNASKLTNLQADHRAKQSNHVHNDVHDIIKNYSVSPQGHTGPDQQTGEATIHRHLSELMN